MANVWKSLSARTTAVPAISSPLRRYVYTAQEAMPPASPPPLTATATEPLIDVTDPDVTDPSEQQRGRPRIVSAIPKPTKRRGRKRPVETRKKAIKRSAFSILTEMDREDGEISATAQGTTGSSASDAENILDEAEEYDPYSLDEYAEYEFADEKDSDSDEDEDDDVDMDDWYGGFLDHNNTRETERADWGDKGLAIMAQEALSEIADSSVPTYPGYSTWGTLAVNFNNPMASTWPNDVWRESQAAGMPAQEEEVAWQNNNAGPIAATWTNDMWRDNQATGMPAQEGEVASQSGNAGDPVGQDTAQLGSAVIGPPRRIAPMRRRRFHGF